MSGKVQVIGRQFDFVFGDNAIYRLHFISAKQLDVTVVADPSYAKGTLNHFEIALTEIRPDVYIVTWVESATGNTVTHVEDYERGVAFTNITDLASKQFWRLKGTIRPVDTKEMRN
jgi:hypothetical protein